jgi:hypothetical protein
MSGIGDKIKGYVVTNMTEAGGHRVDLMASLVTSLIEVLSHHISPVDIIIIISRYARSRSLVICGGQLGYAPHACCITINPTAVHLGLQSQWQLLPFLPITAYIRNQWIIHNDINLVLGMDETVHPPCSLTYNDEPPIPLILASRSSKSATVSDDGTKEIKSGLPQWTNPPLPNTLIDGIIYGNAWANSSSCIIPPPPVVLSEFVTYNDRVYQFGADVRDPPSLRTSASYYDTRSAVASPLLSSSSSSSPSSETSIDDMITNNKWQSLPLMKQPRIRASTCVWRDRIYLIGGDKDDTPTNRISCFDTLKHRWLPESRGGTRRYGNKPMIINIGDHIGLMVLVGMDDRQQQRSNIELFEPNRGVTSSGRWTPLSLKLPFHPSQSWHDMRGIYVDDGILVLMVGGTDDIWAIRTGNTVDDVKALQTSDWFKLPKYPLVMCRSPSLFAI